MKKEFDYDSHAVLIGESITNGNITQALEQYEKAAKRKMCDSLLLIVTIRKTMTDKNYDIFSKYLIARLTVKAITS